MKYVFLSLKTLKQVRVSESQAFLNEVRVSEFKDNL